MVEKYPDTPIKSVDQEESLAGMQDQCTETRFSDFTGYEYNLFWALQLLIIFCTICIVGGNLEHCLNVFFQVINPLTWL